jgi:hypothetical protein
MPAPMVRATCSAASARRPTALAIAWSSGDGESPRVLAARLVELETEHAALEMRARMASAATVIELHPNAAESYRRKIDQIRERCMLDRSRRSKRSRSFED